MERDRTAGGTKPFRVVIGRFLRGLRRSTKRHNERVLSERGETVASLKTRDATEADIPALAQLHVVAWNDTYAPTRGPTKEIREWQWRQAFAEPDRNWFCLVIERANGEVVGFAKARRTDHPDYGGELNKIYLRRDYQRMGVGRRLVGHVARRFLSQGITSMWLIGEADNPSAAFHEALGAHNLTNADGTVNYGNYGWHDLRALADVCPAE